jgi:hypothetical protein
LAGDAKPSAPKLAPMAIVAVTTVIEIAVAAATAVFLCIVGSSRSVMPSIGDVRFWLLPMEQAGREGTRGDSMKGP